MSKILQTILFFFLSFSLAASYNFLFENNTPTPIPQTIASPQCTKPLISTLPNNYQITKTNTISYTTTKQSSREEITTTFKNTSLHISFDPKYIPKNSELAHTLYLEAYNNKIKNLTQNHIYPIYHKYDNTFMFSDGLPVPLLPGAKISILRKENLHHEAKNIPYYQHTFSPKERTENLLSKDNETISPSVKEFSGDTLLATKSLSDLFSYPIARIGKTTACVKTKRKNIGKLGISVPYGNGAYAIAQKEHTDPNYLGESTAPFGSLEEFKKTKNYRRELLDPKSFPIETDIIEVTRHSNSQAGEKFGHTNVGIVLQNKIRFLDPYVEVPGYENHEPKLLDDYKDADRVKQGLAVAKVHYYKSSIPITLESKSPYLENT